MLRLEAGDRAFANQGESMAPGKWNFVRLRRCSMARTPICIATIVVALCTGGCLGDRAADRTFRIYQLQSADTYIGQFQIDASQLPPGAVKTRVDSGGQGVPVTSLTIDQRYPIRVVLVPATDDKPSAQDPLLQRKE